MSIVKANLSASGQDQLECSQMGDWEIVVAADAIPAEKYAAEEFQRFFNQATGLDLPLRLSSAEAPRQIRIGAASSAAEWGEEGFCIEVEKDSLSIAGGRPRGVLYGVYQMLEDGLGLRFLTHDHIHVPDAAAAQIPCGTYTYIPPLSFRWSAYRENVEYPEGATRLRVNASRKSNRKSV